jgi:hypothetical protein
VRRLFWVALGLGAGAASAIIASRFVRRQTAKVAPATIAREARGSVVDLAKLVSESINEGKVAMRQRELELRSELEDSERHAGGKLDEDESPSLL